MTDRDLVLPYYNRQGNPITMDEWAEMQIANRGVNLVERTEYDFTAREYEVSVSTVHLGLDHNWGHGPLAIFEPMVFGGPLDERCVRYASEDEAVAGHKVMCAAVEAAATLPQLGTEPDDDREMT